MADVHFTDRQWAFIQPFLPSPSRTGRPRAEDRWTVEGILYVLITGCRWKDLPREYGELTTVWRRLKRWSEAGVLDGLARATECHASDILRGDLSIYPEVKAYRDENPWPWGQR